MRLAPPDITVLLNAIEASFGPFDIDRLLETRFGLRLHNVSAAFKRFPDQTVDIHRHFDQRNETEQLIAALRDARPSVSEFVVLADKAGFTQLPPQANLEVLVRKDGQPYHDVTVFRADLSKREAAVCRVETPNGFGTGALVANDMVLTNRHVIASALDGAGKLSDSVVCLFDYKRSADGYTTPGLRIPVTAVLASSLHAKEDESGDENMDKSKLDYAVLKLEREIGKETLIEGGEKRGFIPVGAPPPTARQSTGLLVLQHPAAKPMKIDIGAVTWTGATRLRHSVNTEGGSSGSPVLDAGLNLVAIHHAGFDWPRKDYPYNQAVPLSLIAADIRARGVSI